MGLIGGSIGLALKKSGKIKKITGYDVSKDSLIEAREIGAIDCIADDLKKAVLMTEVIIIAAPLGQYESILKEISPLLNADVIVTDVGSVKGFISSMFQKYLPKNIQFIGGHPMAGSEKDGIKAARSSMYENAYYFLTPSENTTQNTIEKIKTLVTEMKAYPIIVTPQEHDKIVAMISHIPHLTAAMLVISLSLCDGTKYLPFAGGGFRDSTRIASGNPEMWKDIFLYNKTEVLRSIEGLQKNLSNFKYALYTEKEDEILEILGEAKRTRDKIPGRFTDYMPPLHEIVIDVEDKPGILGNLTRILGENNINIKDIEILHAREGEKGVVKIGLESEDDRIKAKEILKRGRFPFTYERGVVNNVKGK